ncbi:MAG: ABC transporter ATP-binding protein [Clostridia bacterium]|nr:ABC transporter ATP-binding protein [Clostridia bacterium]
MEVLKVNSITKKYLTKTVLNNLNLALTEGKIYGLLGPNASGKTTLLKLIAGLTQPTGGSFSVSGKQAGVATKNLVSYLPTINHLPRWMTVGNCLSYYQDFYRDFSPKQAEERMVAMGLQPKQKISSLSTGMLGRLKIVLAMSRQSKLYLLDEPFNGLDPISREKVLEMILDAANEDNAVVIATHIIKEIESIMDEVIFLHEGQVALMGNVENLRQTRNMSVEELYKEVYGDA